MADAEPTALAPRSGHSIENTLRQFETLLEVSESIAQHRDLGALFHDLAARLHRVVQFDYLNLVLHDPQSNVMRLHILETAQPHQIQPGLALPLSDTPSGLVFETQQPYLSPDISEENRFPEFVKRLTAEGIRAVSILPLTTAQRRIGALGFGLRASHNYSRDEVEFMLRVAAQVAVAVDNALNYQSAQTYQQQLAQERDHLRVLLEINNAVVSNLERHDLFAAIATSLRRVVPHDFLSLATYDAAQNLMRIHTLDYPGGSGRFREEMTVALQNSPDGSCFQGRTPKLSTRVELESFDSEVVRLLLAEGVRTMCCVPLVARDRVIGVLSLSSLRDAAFSQEDVDLLRRVAGQVAIAVENALAFKEIAELKNRLADEKLYLEDEIRSELNFEEIVGASSSLKQILKQAETVAPTDSTVLILGETGTGKELIARAIHNLSHRRDRTFVKINCAAIPTGLLESELFGHERGAFTGAIAQKLGRFELADKGTLFLDEVGDIPLELQPKLLRVLQEQEFERLGGTRTIHADVRIVAATNRDLSALVDEGRFRSDLYYRFNVFPLRMPPLRERADDIPLLVRYFVQKYSRRMNKTVESVSTESLQALARYAWPGNIRELENLVERAVIVSSGPVLRIPVSDLKAPRAADALTGAGAGPTTLEETERQAILRALGKTNWILGGPRGAAARLGMKRTTLQSRMQKLGISRP
ncbi:MAG TPA: sigma 54-interacting transcriptional regulator [Candidatus Acidoferrales bacterium]|nr:sigma 54-interacting transcriptional regulator [Candidatus Acidoferrales bacterium]